MPQLAYGAIGAILAVVMGLLDGLHEPARPAKHRSLFSRADLAEPPPEGYRDLPLPDGWTERQFPTLAEVKAYCASTGGQFKPRSEVGGCTNYAQQEIVIPTLGRAVDQKRHDGIREHEIAHAYGLLHPDEYRGWVDAQGRRITDASPRPAGLPVRPRQ